VYLKTIKSTKYKVFLSDFIYQPNPFFQSFSVLSIRIESGTGWGYQLQPHCDGIELVNKFDLKIAELKIN
jgi:hypothetical protein